VHPRSRSRCRLRQQTTRDEKGVYSLRHDIEKQFTWNDRANAAEILSLVFLRPGISRSSELRTHARGSSRDSSERTSLSHHRGISSEGGRNTFGNAFIRERTRKGIPKSARGGADSENARAGICGRIAGRLIDIISAPLSSRARRQRLRGQSGSIVADYSRGSRAKLERDESLRPASRRASSDVMVVRTPLSRA